MRYVQGSTSYGEDGVTTNDPRYVEALQRWRTKFPVVQYNDMNNWACPVGQALYIDKYRNVDFSVFNTYQFVNIFIAHVESCEQCIAHMVALRMK
jgi:hypothetical protein